MHILHFLSANFLIFGGAINHSKSLQLLPFHSSFDMQLLLVAQCILRLVAYALVNRRLLKSDYSRILFQCLKDFFSISSGTSHLFDDCCF